MPYTCGALTVLPPADPRDTCRTRPEALGSPVELTRDTRPVGVPGPKSLPKKLAAPAGSPLPGDGCPAQAVVELAWWIGLVMMGGGWCS